MVKNKQVWAVLTGVVLLTLAPSLPIKAQEDYQKEAGGLSSLYRGRRQNLYPYRFNGTFFLNTRAFSRGEVLYNGKHYKDVLLNLDAVAMDLIVKPSDAAAGVVLYRDQVAWFRMGKRKFVNLRYLGYTEADDGFYELLRQEGHSGSPWRTPGTPWTKGGLRNCPVGRYAAP